MPDHVASPACARNLSTVFAYLRLSTIGLLGLSVLTNNLNQSLQPVLIVLSLLDQYVRLAAGYVSF